MTVETGLARKLSQLCLRLYNARAEALTFDWLPPAVQKA